MVDDLRNIIIFDYAKNMKPIDEDFFRRIAKVYKEHYNLGDYMKEIKYEPTTHKDSCAVYNSVKKVIIIDTDLLESKIKEMILLMPNEFTNSEKEIFKYFEFARILLHELTHSLQIKDSDVEWIEELPEGRRRLMAGVDPFFMGNVMYSIQKYEDGSTYKRLKKWSDYQYEKYGCNVLRERDAEIQSYSLIYSILNGLENVFPHVQKYMKANVHQAATMGYKVSEVGEVVSPLHMYAKIFRRNDMIAPYYNNWFDEDIRKSTELTCKYVPKLSDRLRYGMPITSEEYLKMKQTRHRYFEEGYIVGEYGSSDRRDDLDL